jgi:hypothetical protein
MAVVPLNKPALEVHRSVSETRLLTIADIETWARPRFQRPIRINHKVMQFVEELKTNGGIIGGVITLGQVPNDPTLFTVDGSHRLEAAKLSELREFIADIRIMQFASMAEMAEEFVRLNSHLVSMRPDDILRGLEENMPLLRQLRETCDFIGYDNVRRGTHSCVVGMSPLLRCWFGSDNDTPSQNAGGSSVILCERLDDLQLQSLTAFLNTAYSAWGGDPEYYRLWSNLNLTMCMWLWRQLVLKQEKQKGRRYIVLHVTQFKQCLMSVSASTQYVDWLLGRTMNERDRSPCFQRLRTIFLKRLVEMGVKHPIFIKPSWDKN